MADGTAMTVATQDKYSSSLEPLGTIWTADQDPIADGIQIFSQGGTIRFTVLAPVQEGVGLISAFSDIGNAHGKLELVYTNSVHTDSDGDGLTDDQEIAYGTGPYDLDTDDDGLTDGQEDQNWDGIVGEGETDPRKADTDEDHIPEGVEKQVTVPVDDPGGEDILEGTDPAVFELDQDPGSGTDPTEGDSDGDGILDGEEDLNRNGRVDA